MIVRVSLMQLRMELVIANHHRKYSSGAARRGRTENIQWFFYCLLFLCDSTMRLHVFLKYLMIYALMICGLSHRYLSYPAAYTPVVEE